MTIEEIIDNESTNYGYAVAGGSPLRVDITIAYRKGMERMREIMLAKQNRDVYDLIKEERKRMEIIIYDKTTGKETTFHYDPEDLKKLKEFSGKTILKRRRRQ